MRKGLLILLLAIPIVCLATTPEPGVIQSLSDKFMNEVSLWGMVLTNRVVKPMFFTLSLISLFWLGARLALQGADFPEIAKELVSFILLMGFWLFIIEDAFEYAKAILESFTQAAGLATAKTVAMDPVDIMNTGIHTGAKIIEGAGFFEKIGYALAALIVVIIYFYIAALVFLALIEAYIVAGAGIVVLGFAGSPWTSDIAKKYLLFVLSVGLKMFFTFLIVGVGLQFIDGFQNADYGDNLNILALIGIVFLLAYLTGKLPQMAQSILSGASFTGTNDVRGITAVAGKNAKAGLMAGAGTVAGLVQAGKGAWAEMKAGSGGATSALAAATSPSQGVMGGSSSLGSAGAGDNDKSAIPEAISARSASSSGASATPTPTPAAAGAMAAAEKEAGNADNPTAGANAAKTANPAGNSAEKQSRISAGVQAMKAYAAKADNAVKHAPELMRKTAKNYAKGSIAGTAESLAKPSSQRSPFDIARTISAQNISKKIDRESE